MIPRLFMFLGGLGAAVPITVGFFSLLIARDNLSRYLGGSNRVLIFTLIPTNSAF